MNNEGNTAVGFFKGIRKNIVPVSPNQKKEFRSLSRPIPRPRPRRTFHASMRIREQTETDTENEDESSSVLEYSAGTSSGTSFIRSELSLGDPSTPQDSLMELFGNGYWPESEDGQTPSSGERREASSQRSSPCSETDVRACSSTCYSENNLDHSSIDALSSSVHETGGPGCAQTSSQDNCNESCTHSQGNPDCLSFGAILGSEGDLRYMENETEAKLDASLDDDNPSTSSPSSPVSSEMSIDSSQTDIDTTDADFEQETEQTSTTSLASTSSQRQFEASGTLKQKLMLQFLAKTHPYQAFSARSRAATAAPYDWAWTWAQPSKSAWP